MDYSLITHMLADSVTVSGRIYRLDTRAFKALQAYAAIAEDDIPEELKIERVLELMLDPASYLMLGKSREDAGELFIRITEFLKGWPEAERPARGKRMEDIFSFTEDHALIVAAFRQAYGVTLAELKAMHWWEFRALLRGMPEGTVLSSVMGIRSMEIDPKEPPKVKAAKRKAKEAAALRRTGGRAKTGEEIISEAFAGL